MGANATLTGPWLFFLEDFEGLGSQPIPWRGPLGCHGKIPQTIKRRMNHTWDFPDAGWGWGRC